MTNRELLIAALKDELDDWAASESTIAYNIACPYYGIGLEEKHPCHDLKWPWNTLDVCGPCKIEWLDREESE